MARQPKPETVFVLNLLSTNPDLTYNEALPLLEVEGYGDMKDYTFNNLKSKAKKDGKVGNKTKRKGTARPRVYSPKPEAKEMEFAEAMQLLKTSYGEDLNLKVVKADLAKYQKAVEVVENLANQLSAVMG